MNDFWIGVCVGWITDVTVRERHWIGVGRQRGIFKTKSFPQSILRPKSAESALLGSRMFQVEIVNS